MKPPSFMPDDRSPASSTVSACRSNVTGDREQTTYRWASSGAGRPRQSVSARCWKTSFGRKLPRHAGHQPVPGRLDHDARLPHHRRVQHHTSRQ